MLHRSCIVSILPAEVPDKVAGASAGMMLTDIWLIVRIYEPQMGVKSTWTFMEWFNFQQTPCLLVKIMYNWKKKKYRSCWKYFNQFMSILVISSAIDILKENHQNGYKDINEIHFTLGLLYKF